MIRPAHLTDETQIMDIASSVGLFEPDQLTLLRDMFRKSTPMADDGSPFWLISETEEAIGGVVYCEPELMTDGTWNIQLIAVHPNQQKCGIGGNLIKATEQALKRQNARIVLVETAGIPEFEHVREFYGRRGYEMESKIRDFYGDGVDNVTFRKRIS